MKKNLFALVVVAICVLSGYAQADKPFVSKDGRFSVVPPIGFEELKFSTKTRHNPYGDVEVNIFMLNLGHAGCSIEYYDFQDEAYKQHSVDQWVSFMAKGAQSVPGMTASNLENTTVDGYPGFSIDMSRQDDKDPLYIRTVTVIAKPRVYVYKFSSSDKADLNRADVLKFFRTFHIQK